MGGYSIMGGRCHAPSKSASSELQRSGRLLGPLDVKPMAWAECLFADPVADIAVLGVPDEQYLSSEAAAFEALVESARCS